MRANQIVQDFPHRPLLRQPFAAMVPGIRVSQGGWSHPAHDGAEAAHPGAPMPVLRHIAFNERRPKKCRKATTHKALLLDDEETHHTVFDARAAV